MATPYYCEKPFSERTIGEATECGFISLVDEIGRTYLKFADAFGRVFNAPSEATMSDWGAVAMALVMGLCLLVAIFSGRRA